MAYDKNTPASINETFSASQPKIKDNFNAIKTLVDVNHVTFDAGNQGKHKYVTLPDFVIADLPATSATEIMLYSYAQALWFRPKSQAGAAATNDIDFTTATLAASGCCTLPCGLKMAWGAGTATGPGGAANNFSTAFPNHVYSVTVTQNVGAGHQEFVYVSGLALNGFTAYAYTREAGAATTSIYYTAIGD